MTPPKKIILISLDTLRADHLGCYGYPRNTSPTIDEVAGEGILFKNAFSPSSFTTPAHASIFTGKSPSHHSIGFNQFDGKLDTNIDITLAEFLKATGFKTAAFISSFVLRNETNLNSGFDVYDDEMTSHELNNPINLIRDGTETSCRAIQWVQDNYEDNFFLFIHLFDVHGPYICKEPYKNLFVKDSQNDEIIRLNSIVPNSHPIGGIPFYQALKRTVDIKGNTTSFETNIQYYISQYDGCIRYVDDNINLLLKKLQQLGIYDDSFIIITSDHGEAFGENDIYFYHGLTVTPDQIHVPLIIKPHKEGNVKQQIIELPVSTIDILPTILSICNFDYDNLDLEGQSLISTMENLSDRSIKKKRILISENEHQLAEIFPNLQLKLTKKETPASTYYTYIQDLIDSLDGKWFNTINKQECQGNHFSTDIYSLPFDVYTKNFLVKNIVTGLPKKGSPITLLDVGGRSGQLSDFFLDDEVYIIDIQPPKIENSSNFVRGSAITLPFKDNSFPVVVSLDVLEHVPQVDRNALMNELARVSSEYIIIGAPFKSHDVEHAEKIANDLYQNMTGKPHPMLIEHIEQGLPDPEIFENWLNAKEYSYKKIGTNNLENWLLLELLLLFSHENEILFKDKYRLLSMYNKNFVLMGDLLEPTYRKLYLISKNQIPLPAIIDDISYHVNIEKRLDLLKNIYCCIYNNAHLHKSQNLQLLDSISSEEQYIVNLKKTVIEKDQFIHSLLNVIEEKDQSMVEKDRYISSLKSTILEKDQSMTENDRYISSLKSTVLEKDQSMVEKDRYISSLKSTILEKDQSMAENDRYISSLKSTILEKDQYINTLLNPTPIKKD
jgi:arylsulfatase A-like enzyme